MSSTRSVLSVTPSEANDFISELDPIILDVRTPQEFIEGHIYGAINLPLTDLSESVVLEKLGKPDPGVLVYCKSGRSSFEASEMLAEMGYKNVCSLDSGIDGWPFGVVS